MTDFFTDVLPVAIPVVGAAVAGVFGVLYGNKKGLPDIRKDLEESQDKLLATYKERLELAEKVISECQPKLAEAAEKIRDLETANRRLEREVAALYRRLDGSGRGRSPGRSEPS